MTDTDLYHSDHGPLRAAAEAAEPAQAASGLASIDGCRLAGSGPLAPLARDVARSMTEADLIVHHCARHDPLYRIGGVYMLAVSAESGTGHGRIVVSWTAHNLLQLESDRYGAYISTQQAMNAALGGVLRAFGYADILQDGQIRLGDLVELRLRAGSRASSGRPFILGACVRRCARCWSGGTWRLTVFARRWRMRGQATAAWC
jgi:hypothetical protein